ncbi:MAG: hypothetical protein R2728_08360 [Chitinophagales bacterium]
MKINTINKVSIAAILVASMVILFRRVWLMELDTFEFDDAFMFIRYAENILAGYGYTWNPGEPLVYGNTSILFTYIVALNKLLFGSVLSNSWILSSATFVFAIAFLVALIQGLFKHVQSELLQNRLLIGAITLPFLVMPLILGFHISTGMETTLSLFLNTIFIFSIWSINKLEKVKFTNVIAPALIGYAMFLCRPDNALVVALFPFLFLGFNKKYKHLLYLGATLFVLIVIDSIIKYLAFGEILPLSFYAKKSGFTEGYTAKYFWNPVKYITQIIAYLMPYIILIFVFVRKKYLGWLTSFLLPLLLTFTYYLTFDQIMGFNARLYFPFIPYIIIPAVFLLDKTIVQYKNGDKEIWNYNSLITKTCLLIVFLFFTVFSKYRFINKYETYAINAGNKDAIAVQDLDHRKYNREVSIKKISNLLKEFPDDFVFAATEHGFISGDNPKKVIVDLSGLHNYEIAKNGYSEKVIQDTKPDFIWMPHQDLTVLHYNIRSGAYFQSEYEYITNVYAFGCAIRKDSKYYEELKSLVN